MLQTEDGRLGFALIKRVKLEKLSVNSTEIL